MATKNTYTKIANNFNSNISGIFSTKPTAMYSSGARTILRINGEIVGFAFGISWNITTQAVEINTIDDYTPHEFAPQRIYVDGTISALHIPGQSAGTLGWQADSLNFLTQQYITIEVRDVNEQLLFYAPKVMIMSRREEVRVDSLSSVQLSWRAIGFRDESQP